MTDTDNVSASHFSEMQGDAYNDEEIRELRRRAWIEQGIFIALCKDGELLPYERRSLLRIGHKLYGKAGAA
ncbi:MAG: hypothetical protein AAF065_13215 [Verrucomicrobiota bacterium]